MSTVIDVFEALESVSGRLAKESILDENRDDALLKSTLVAALDPYTVYYVNKFKMPEADGVERDDVVVANFLNVVLPPLAARRLTGNEAKAWVRQAFASMDERQQKWCQRILLKNLRCGIQGSTVNKTWPDLIKPFSCSLCDTLKTKPTKKGGFEITDVIRYPVFVEPKLDGLRLIAVKRDGKVTMYTRNGTEIETLPGIIAVLEKARFDNVVFDGEAMGEDWNESASVLMSHKKHKDETKIAYNVFDTMTLEEWISQDCSTIRSARQRNIAELLEQLPEGSRVRQVESTLALSEKVLRDCYERHITEGYEGVVIKDPNAPYVFKRSKSMLKLKPVTTYEGAIVGWYEGRENTKREGEFGGFEVVLPNGVVTRCGGGFSDALRTEIMKRGPREYTGQIVEMEGQPPLTADGKVRFPVFVRYRDRSDVDPAVVRAYEDYEAAGRVVNV
jgi:DNA ligase-1